MGRDKLIDVLREAIKAALDETGEIATPEDKYWDHLGLDDIYVESALDLGVVADRLQEAMAAAIDAAFVTGVHVRVLTYAGEGEDDDDV